MTSAGPCRKKFYVFTENDSTHLWVIKFWPSSLPLSYFSPLSNFFFLSCHLSVHWPGSAILHISSVLPLSSCSPSLLTWLHWELQPDCPGPYRDSGFAAADLALQDLKKPSKRKLVDLRETSKNSSPQQIMNPLI